MIRYHVKAMALAAALAAPAALSSYTALADPTIAITSTSTPGLKTWGKSIGKQLRREMGYPKHFDTAGEYGAVIYQLDVDRAGQVHAAKQIKSSGYARLDESAAETIANMSALPAMPQKLAAQRAIVVLQLAYLPLKTVGAFNARRQKATTDLLELTAGQSAVKITLLSEAPSTMR